MLSPSGEQGQAVMPARVVALLFILLYDGLAIGDVAVHGDVACELLPQPPRDRVEAPHSVGHGVIEHA
jgi:hypothetical protein